MRRFLIAVTSVLAVFALGAPSSHREVSRQATQVEAACDAPPGMNGTCDSSWGG